MLGPGQAIGLHLAQLPARLVRVGVRFRVGVRVGVGDTVRVRVRGFLWVEELDI